MGEGGLPSNPGNLVFCVEINFLWTALLCHTGCFFSNDTVRQDIAKPVLHLEISTMGQIKGKYVRFCMLSTKSFHLHVMFCLIT